MNKVILVGVNKDHDEKFAYAMEELKELAYANEMEVIDTFTQSLRNFHKQTYLGTGKVEELYHVIEENNCDTVIVKDELTTAQVRNLEGLLLVRVMDKTGLILEIFAKRAKTKEAKLQVEIARLQYEMPRLIGSNVQLSRQRGGRNKGAGEQKLELDRRNIEGRIQDLKKQVKIISDKRETQRRSRNKNDLPLVSLVGYTNAGKSTIMNGLLDYSKKCEDKKVFEKDMLFATLETSVRRIETENKQDFLLSDTVGFLNDLPHQLIKAFTSTLDEAIHADLLLQVIDRSYENYEEHMQTTLKTLTDIHANEIPMLYVYNKIDKCEDIESLEKDNCIFISAKNENDIRKLCTKIQSMIYKDVIQTTFMIPYDKANIVSYFMDTSNVLSQEYVDEGIKLTVDALKKDREKYSEYLK